MKKFFTLMIIIGVCIGAVLVTKQSAILKEEEEKEEIEPIINENYIDELNLPLIEVDTLNPLLTQNKIVSDTLKLIYEPLYDFDEQNKIVKKLAEEATEKDDLTWIIKLNKDAKWHSGKELLAEDVIFTYNSILNSEKSSYKENIKNIEDITVLDEHDIQITLKSRDKLLPYKLTFPIIPKYYFENDLQNEMKNTRAVGTGPYKYDSITTDSKIITLVANTNWWKKEDIKLKKIYLYEYSSYGEAMKAFKSSEIDVISTTMIEWQKKFGVIGINEYMYENTEFDTIIPNTNNDILKESSVRRMLLSAINSNNIIDKVLNGNGMASNYPIKSISYLNNYEGNVNYDVEKAKQLLINAGWSNKDGVWRKEINEKNMKLEFNLLINSDSDDKEKIADLVIENLNEIGVKINKIKVNTAEYNKRIENGNFELALATLNINQDINILELINSNSNKNYAKYENIDLENIISEINKDNIEEKFSEIQTLYKTEVPYIGMYYRCNNLLTNKSVKGNINPTSWNIYNNITGWCK